MNSKQAQTGNDILNYLCRFINNKPVGFSRITRDMKMSAEELEENIQAMMAIHPDWYTLHKKTFGRQALMLNAPMLKDVHKFLVFGGYPALVANAAQQDKGAEVKDKDEKATNTRNTVIITPKMDLNHS